MYGTGISRVGEVLDMATDLGIVKKGGAWYSYNDAKLGQGRDNSKEFLLNNPEIMDEIEAKIKENKAAAEAEVTTKKTKKESKLAEKAAAAAEASKPSDDDDEQFEEFAPVDITGLGD